MNTQNPGDVQPPNDGQGQPPQQSAPQGYPAPQGQAPQGYPGLQSQPGQGYAPQGQQNGQPGYRDAAPTQKPAGENPFAGIPVVDYVTDGLAALLLLISLGLPWNVMNGATDRVEVILLLVLSLLSLSVHYLARFGVFPNTWPPRMIAMLRAALNLPFILLVLVYVVLDVLAAFDIGSGYGGLGGAAALGLAGAMLAAAPRKAQIDEDPYPLQSKVWPLVFLGISGLVILLQFAAIIVVFINSSPYSNLKIDLLRIVTILTVTAITGWALFGVFRRDHSWRLVTGVLGITAASAFILLWSDRSDSISIHVMGTGGFGLAYVFLPALGALALSPIIKNTMKAKPVDQVWTGAARSAAEYLLLVAGSVIVTAVFSFVARGFVGADLAVLLMAMIIAVAGLLARIVLTKDVSAGRNQALVLVGVATLFAIVVLIITASSKSLAVGLPELLLAFGLPGLFFIGLTAPKAVREHFAANPPAALAMPTQVNSQQSGQPAAAGQQPWEAQQQAAQGQQPWEAQQQAQEPEPVPAAPAHGFTAEMAANPSTELATLAQIAQQAPELRAAVASNPSTYPDLVNWLGSLNDPEVNAAIAARQA